MREIIQLQAGGYGNKIGAPGQTYPPSMVLTLKAPTMEPQTFSSKDSMSTTPKVWLDGTSPVLF